MMVYELFNKNINQKSAIKKKKKPTKNKDWTLLNATV